MLDVFKNDVFSTLSLTTSINKLPYVPSRLGSMGLFKSKGITTRQAVIEEQFGKLMLVPTQARGTMPNVMGGKTRRAKSFIVPSIPLNAAVYADDVQDVRAFGSEDQVQAVAEIVNDKLADMKQNLEVTKEWHRIGAIQGQVLDADGTTVIYDWFDEFGITEEEVEFDFSEDNNVKLNAIAVQRHIENVLGATSYGSVHALVGKNFFDELITCDEVKEAFNRWKEGQHMRDSQFRTVFEYADIKWEEYRGHVGDQEFIHPDEARFFPVGAPGVFEEIYAPAPFMETVNTKGQPFYSKKEEMKWDLGIELHAQTNPLMICTRPSVLVKGTMVGGS